MNLVKSTLGEIALEIKTGKTPPTSNPEYFGDELNWYTPTDLDREKILGKSKRRITQKALIDKKIVVLKPNTILLGCIGDIGKIGLIKESASSNQQITGILPKEEIINSEFLYYWLKNNKNILKENSKNAIVSILNNKQLAAIKIEFPENLDDQIHIAEILAQAEALITKRKESILMLEELVKSTFLEMFGDVLLNSKEWPLQSFETLVRLKRGYDLPKSERREGIYPLFASSSIIDYHDEYKVKGPGVITGRSGTIGIVNYSSHEFWPLNTTLYSEWFDGNIIYIKYFLEYFKLERFSNGAGVPTLNRNLLHNENIIAVPIKLQNQFAIVVEKVEILKVEYQNSLVELENLFGVLNQKAFKGELIKTQENQLDKKKDDTVMEEEPDEIIDNQNYIREKKEKIDITNMTFAEYIDFPEDLQVKHENWMFNFLEDNIFYQFLLKDNFNRDSFTLSKIETELHDFFYHGGDMDFDNEKWSRIIFEFMKADPPLIIQNFDKDSATIKLKLTDEAYKA